MAERIPSWCKIPFIARIPVHRRGLIPGENFLTHILDTNGVRALGRLKERSWQKLLANWKAKGYTTGWVPWTVTEITGTNLLENGGVVSQEELDQIILAVQRMDILAGGDVLPDVDQMIVYSMYQFAKAHGGPSHLNDSEDNYRYRIHVLKQVTSRDQITRMVDPDGSVFIGFKDGDEIFGQPYKETFKAHAPKAVALVRKLMEGTNLNADSSDQEVAYFINKHLGEMLLRKGLKFRLSVKVMDAIGKAFRVDAKTIPDAPFTVAAYCEFWYYTEFARGRLKRKHKENDGADFKISAYMSVADHFVMDDGRLCTLISHYMREAARRIIKPCRFYRRALQA